MTRSKVLAVGALLIAAVVASEASALTSVPSYYGFDRSPMGYGGHGYGPSAYEPSGYGQPGGYRVSGPYGPTPTIGCDMGYGGSPFFRPTYNGPTTY